MKLLYAITRDACEYVQVIIYTTIARIPCAWGRDVANETTLTSLLSNSLKHGQPPVTRQTVGIIALANDHATGTSHFVRFLETI